jgi:transcriptional regulator with XRE-family HTH domain
VTKKTKRPSDWLRDLVADRATALGLSQAELARQSGLNQPTVYRYLAGARSISSGQLQHLLTALGLTVVVAGDATKRKKGTKR